MSETALEVKKTEALEHTPAQLLELAVQQNLDIDKLERLMGMQERWEARQAKKSFYEALSKFQEIVPELIRSKIVDFTSRAGVRVLYAYAPLSAIVNQIKKPLSNCGLSYRWEQEAVGDQIAITAIITHLDGHSESTRIESVLDETGVKNAVQSRGSTITYLQRYSLIGALGLATAESDVDAATITQGISETLPDDFEHDSDAYPSAGKHAEGATGAKADPKSWHDIPDGYLNMIIERGKNKDLMHHAIAEKGARKKGQAPKPDAPGKTDFEKQQQLYGYLCEITGLNPDKSRPLTNAEGVKFSAELEELTTFESDGKQVKGEKSLRNLKGKRLNVAIGKAKAKLGHATAKDELLQLLQNENLHKVLEPKIIQQYIKDANDGRHKEQWYLEQLPVIKGFIADAEKEKE